MTNLHVMEEKTEKPMVFAWQLEEWYALPVGSLVDVYISKNEDVSANRIWKTGCRVEGIYEHFLHLKVPYRPKVSWCGTEGEYGITVAYRDIYSGRIALRTGRGRMVRYVKEKL